MIREWDRCSQSPYYFLKTYGKVLNDDKGGVTPFETPLHLTELLYIFSKYPRILILKARQTYITWLFSGYGLGKGLFHEGSHVLLLSRGEKQADTTLGYCKFIHDHLPQQFHVTRMPDDASLIGFPSKYSQIRALPATAEAGIGYGRASLIIGDEFDFHEKAEENYVQMLPMLSGRSGQLILGSAPNKYDIETKFKELFLEAIEGNSWLRAEDYKIWIPTDVGKNNFYPVFIPYNVIPDRDDNWYEQKKQELDPWELEGQFPRTVQEALSAPQLVCRFDVKALSLMQTRCLSPLRIERNGLVKIYAESIAEKKYCLVADPSEGDYDPSGAMVIDWRYCEKAADYYGKISLDEQARIIHEFYEKYNHPYTAVERNAAGIALIDRLQAMGINNWYFCDKGRQKPGWWTSSANRGVMITDLAEAVRLFEIREPNEQAIDQFYSFIRTKKKLEGEARKGCHDEFPIMWGIFLQIRKEMPAGDAVMVSGKYKMSW